MQKYKSFQLLHTEKSMEKLQICLEDTNADFEAFWMCNILQKELSKKSSNENNQQLSGK